MFVKLGSLAVNTSRISCFNRNRDGSGSVWFAGEPEPTRIEAKDAETLAAALFPEDAAPPPKAYLLTVDIGDDQEKTPFLADNDADAIEAGERHLASVREAYIVDGLRVRIYSLEMGRIDGSGFCGTTSSRLIFDRGDDDGDD